MKAITLSRVSTKEQEEGHSINAQNLRLDEYCFRKSMDVIKRFEIIESSTKGERKLFMQMIAFIKSQRETIALVTDAVDRFQRSFKESVMIDELIRAEKVELHFCRENMIIGKNASSSDILRWDFSVMGAKSYVLNLSENVRRSLEFKRRNGEWSGKAPLGYLNIRDENNKSAIAQDPDRAHLIRRLFENYATGVYSITGDLVEQAKSWGLTNKSRKNHTGGPLSASQIHLILQNPFYYGEMLSRDRLIPHKYLPLISRELFEHCQNIRLGTKRQDRAHYSEKPFLFRGLIRCATSGRIVINDIKKGKFIYLICHDPANPKQKLFIPEAVVVKQVADVFKRFQLPQETLTALMTHLQDSHEAEKRFHKEVVGDLRKKYEEIDKKISTLLDLRLNGSVAQDQFEAKSDELRRSQLALRISIEQHQRGQDDFRLTLGTVLNITSRAYEIFESSSLDQKRQLINFVFSNLQLRGKKLEYSMRSPFDRMVKLQNHQDWLGD